MKSNTLNKELKCGPGHPNLMGDVSAHFRGVGQDDLWCPFQYKAICESILCKERCLQPILMSRSVDQIYIPFLLTNCDLLEKNSSPINFQVNPFLYWKTCLPKADTLIQIVFRYSFQFKPFNDYFIWNHQAVTNIEVPWLTQLHFDLSKTDTWPLHSARSDTIHGDQKWVLSGCCSQR